MPSPPAKRRPRRRRVLPPLTAGQQVLFSFDSDFPQDQRKPAAERVLAARRPKKKTIVVVPDGMHIHVGRLLLVDGRSTFVPSTLTRVGRSKFPGGPPDLPLALPSTEPPPRPRRGRPRKRVPTGTWENDDLLCRVKAIVNARRDREDDALALESGAAGDILDALYRLAHQVLGKKLTRLQQDDLRALVFGGDGPSGKHKRAEKASVITYQLLAWQHGLGDRDVRRLKKIRRLVSR